MCPPQIRVRSNRDLAHDLQGVARLMPAPGDRFGHTRLTQDGGWRRDQRFGHQAPIHREPGHFAGRGLRQIPKKPAPPGQGCLLSIFSSAQRPWVFSARSTRSIYFFDSRRNGCRETNSRLRSVPGHITIATHQSIQIDLADPLGQGVVLGMKIHRRHHGDEVAHFFAVNCCVAKTECAALTHAQQVH